MSELLAYTAGIIDGEGCIGIVRNSRGQRAHIVRVMVVNTDERLLRWLKEQFGGDYRPVRPRGYPEHWKTSYHWRLSGTRAEQLLERLLPYLQLKREQAIVALRLRSTKEYEYIRKAVGAYGRLTPTAIVAADALQDELKRLNQKGRQAA